MALDAKERVKEARKNRFASFDTKRKAMADELEERERAFKKQRMDKQKDEVSRWQETEKIKDEGRRLREDRERELKARDQETEKASEREDEIPSLGMLFPSLMLSATYS